MPEIKEYYKTLKDVANWSWTLTVLCLIGYLSLGQLFQLWMMMIFFGGLAASFRGFYSYSYTKAELLKAEFERAGNSKDEIRQLELKLMKIDIAKDIINKYLKSNPDVNPNSYLLVESVNEIERSYTEARSEVWRKKQVAVSEKRGHIKNIENSSKNSLTEEEYRKISNKSDYTYVKPYRRKDGTEVRGHWRKRKRS